MNVSLNRRTAGKKKGQTMNAIFDRLILTWVATGLLFACAGPARAEIMTNVDISSQANFTWGGASAVPGEATVIRLPGAPIGPTTLGGIPFNITSNVGGNQAWNGVVAAASQGGLGNVSVTFNTNVYGATDVYTLINTFAGQPGPNSYVALIFTGSAGAVYEKDLISNVDIRDYNNDGWTNTINGTTTTNVFNVPVDNWGLPGRLDMQHIILPTAFETQTLQQIELVDSGSSILFQRAVLDGITIGSIPPSAVPEPSTFALLSLGGIGLLIIDLRRRTSFSSVSRA